MGVVYRARKSGLQRDFALKIMLGEQDEESVQRFRLEAQVASKLDDRGIVGVFDVGVSHGRHYYVMDYCPGDTLRDRIRTQGRLDPNEAARILTAVAWTMHRAHSKGVLHRDLKPANLLLGTTPGEQPRVADFGLAKDWTLHRNLTQSGDILGTPYYMSPEQFRGKGVDHRSDVWALGVILYECLTGERPFPGSDYLEVGKKVREGRFEPPRAKLASLPADLEAICLCALAGDKANRYMSAEALAQDLDAFLRGETPSHASGVVTPPSRAGNALKALAFTAVTTALVVGAWWSLHTPAEPPVAQTDPLSPKPAKTPAKVEAQVRAALARAEVQATSAAPAEARVAFERAEALATGDRTLAREVAIAKGLFLLRRGFPSEALATVRPHRAGEGHAALEAIRIAAEANEVLGERAAAERDYAELERADRGGLRGETAAAALARIAQEKPDAIAAARRALALDADYPPALFELAVGLLTVRTSDAEHEEAKTLTRRAQALAPGTPRLLFCEALFSERPRAIELLGEAIELSRNAPEAALFRVRGLLHAETGELTAGLKDLDRAIEQGPGASNNYLVRALLSERRAREDWADPRWIEQARADARRALELDPDGVEQLRGGSASTYETIRRLANAKPDPLAGAIPPALRQLLERRAERAREPGREPLLRALLKAASGAPWDVVEPLYKEALNAAPDCPTVATERVLLFVGREAYAQGFAEIQRARRLVAKGGSRALRLDLAEAELHWLAGRAYEAGPLMENIVRSDPESPQGLCARARLLAMHERDDDAEIASKTALDLDPEFVPSLIARATVLYRQVPPRTKEARALLDRVATLNGFLDARAVRIRLQVAQIEAFLNADGTPRKHVTPKQITPLLAAYERAFPLLAGNGLLLDAIQFLLQITGKHPFHDRLKAWLEESLRRQPDLGMNYVLLGRHQLQTGASKEEVLATWRKAREVESRIQYSETLFEEYRHVFGGPCDELSEFEDAAKAPR